LAALVLVELARELAGGGDSGSSELGRPGTALAWTLALPALMAILGFVAGAAIYVVAYSRLRSGETWWRCAAAGVATALALTALLQWLLGVSPPGSVLRG
jgi:uncharacterized membrane protein YoaK (UPF0700 family)